MKWIDEVLEVALQHMPVPEAKPKTRKSESKAPKSDRKSTDIVRRH